MEFKLVSMFVVLLITLVSGIEVDLSGSDWIVTTTVPKEELDSVLGIIKRPFRDQVRKTGQYPRTDSN